MFFEAPIHILCIEDDPATARLLQKRLQREQHEVDIVSDGRKGLEIYKTGTYNVLCVDHRLPGFSGLDVVRSLASEHTLPPTIMITGAGDEKVAVEALKLGVSDYIVKDVDNNYLDLIPHVIKKTLDKERILLEKQVAEEALRKAYDELELRVQERTADLAKSNKELLDEINQRKKAEEEIRKQHELLNSVLESITHPIYLVDANNYSILMANSTAGITTSQAPVKCFTATHGRERPCDPPEHLCPIEVVKKSKQPFVVEHIHHIENGKPRLFEINAYPIFDEYGDVIRVIEYCIDITDQREAEAEKDQLQKQLIQAQKMESLGTLAGGISHDFNNVLQIIIGYSSMLLVSKDLKAQEREQLHSILRAAESGGELAQRILAFSRKIEPNARPIDLNNEIQLTHKMMKRTIPGMISIELRLADQLMTVNGDPGQIEQVLINLIVNAQHAMPDGGRLIIETENVKLIDKNLYEGIDLEPGEYVLISVSDTGHGMDKEVKDRVFEPFFTTKKHGEGSGLGLAMVYGIVKSHLGQVICDSEPGKGTSFKIYLPVIGQNIQQQISPGEEKPAFGTETILLTDDDDNVREMAREMIEMGGYMALTARNGEEALEIYSERGEDISLVVLDLIMPGMSGQQCLKELLRLNRELKVLVASGYSPQSTSQWQEACGAKGFISKPYKPNEFLTTIRRILDESHSSESLKRTASLT